MEIAKESSEVATPSRNAVGAAATLFALLVPFSAAFVFGHARIQYGMSMHDEGMYVSQPLRYVLGDLP